MTHNWNILNEKVLPEFGGKNNVIQTIWFRVTTTDSDRIAKVDGRINLQIDDLSSFVEYEQVSEAQRLNWIKAKYGNDYENYNIDILSQRS